MVREASARNVGELLDAIGKLRSNWSPGNSAPEELWFRGQSRRDLPLLPGLYRAPARASSGDEISHFESFRAYALPLTGGQALSEWDWYFLAQHYGLYTRLLDWTESCLVAAYFALRTESLKKSSATLYEERTSSSQSERRESEMPTVWMLDAGTLNASSIGAENDSVLAVPGPATDPYLPDALWDQPAPEPETASLPIAIFPPRIDPRVSAQQGTFTLHGTRRTSIDELASIDERIQLAAITLHGNRAAMWEELRLAGLSEMSLFPDLDHVAYHVKRSYEI